MATDNIRHVTKPPRRQPGNLQTLPSYPGLLSWPMNAYERSRQTYGSPQSQSTTSSPYKMNWQFRDPMTDGLTHPDFHDLRGGPANLRDVTNYHPNPSPFPNIFGIKPIYPDITVECEYMKKYKEDQKISQKWLSVFGQKYFYVADEHL
ncbi:uncharacterized protein LOC131948336 [Physella acuta]|uniref:uncharacterized protein LOC131948336 n=1 Tax=Physella acuta TaxID=109671 RepID=UPI0027DE00D1|nr:uncharacterized protein LOC131948336 [Physella acuta]